MSVLRTETLEQLSTAALHKMIDEEWERICDVLLRYQPVSDDTLRFLLKDLQMMHKELERRGERLQS